jgi:hypothetical protein
MKERKSKLSILGAITVKHNDRKSDSKAEQSLPTILPAPENKPA